MTPSRKPNTSPSPSTKAIFRSNLPKELVIFDGGPGQYEVVEPKTGIIIRVCLLMDLAEEFAFGFTEMMTVLNGDELGPKREFKHDYHLEAFNEGSVVAMGLYNDWIKSIKDKSGFSDTPITPQ